MSNGLENWELRVWTPTGAGPREILRDDTFIRSTGLRMQLTPEGDCKEATFEARGQGIGLNPLDSVQVVYDGVPVFFGEVRVGGNPRDVQGHQFTVRSLALRLKEVAIPPGWSTPQQPAHLTIRSLLSAVADQLGGLMLLDDALMPDLGFDCRAVVDAYQQNPYALLEQIATDGAGMGVKVRFGVRPDRYFFCCVARSDVAELTADLLTSSVQWQAPVAETPCTAVLWYTYKDPDSGNWTTHLSKAPEADVYGVRIKPLTLTMEVDADRWEDVPVSYNFIGAEPRSMQAGGALFSNEDAAAILDGHGPEPVLALFSIDPATGQHSYSTSAQLQMKALDGGNIDRVRLVASKQELTHDKFAIDINGQPIELNSWTWATQTDYSTVYVATTESTATLTAKKSTVETEGLTIIIVEFRAQRFIKASQQDHSALLDRLATYHYKIPAQEPADIELRDFVPPSALAGRLMLADYQANVDAWEYRLTAARGLTVAALTGQADDPNALAQAELIKSRDQAAVITAITTRTG